MSDDTFAFIIHPIQIKKDVARKFPLLGIRLKNTSGQPLTQGPITKHILQLSIFLAVSMVFQTLYYLVDLYFVSRIGKEAIAGVGLAGNLMFVTLALTQMLGVGTATLISHAAGRKDQARAQLVFNQSFVFSMRPATSDVDRGSLIAELAHLLDATLRSDP